MVSKEASSLASKPLVYLLLRILLYHTQAIDVYEYFDMSLVTLCPFRFVSVVPPSSMLGSRFTYSEPSVLVYHSIDKILDC